jgi:hypothetical protein
LDTGANSILIVDAAAQELVGKGLTSIGLYEELGVAGTSEYYRSSPVTFTYSGNDNPTNCLTLDYDAPILYNPDSVLGGAIGEGGVPGIAGMALMTDRVTTMDMTEYLNTDPNATAELRVEFSDVLPASAGHRYTVPVDTRVTFAAEDGIPTDDADKTTPAWGNVTFLDATAVNGTNQASGAFLFDTGAQMSMLSTAMALSLGLDTSGDGVIGADDDGAFEVSVGGVGGQTTVYALPIDKLLVPTVEGPSLTWYSDESAPMYFIVTDIAPGIDGVFGADLWTGGMTTDYGLGDLTGFPGQITGKPYFDKLSFDFRGLSTLDANGVGHGALIFDVDPSYDVSNVRVTESDSATTVVEGYATDTQTVVLAKQPTADVTIAIASSLSQLTMSTHTLTFTPDNWNVPQTVTFSASDNGISEGTRAGTVTYTASSADLGYNGLVVSITNVRIAERGPIASFVAGTEMTTSSQVVTSDLTSPGQTVYFDASASFDADPSCQVTSYRWNFGDGSAVVTTTSPTVSHVYSASAVGTCTVSLTVADNNATPRTNTTTSTLRVAEAIAAIDLGTLPTIETLGSLDTSTFSYTAGEQWYCLTAKNPGTLTLVGTTEGMSLLTSLGLTEATTDDAGSTGSGWSSLFTIECHQGSSTSTPLATSQIVDDNTLRIDIKGLEAGEKVYIKVAGLAWNLDLRLTNLVQKVGSQVNVFGSTANSYGATGNDTFSLDLNTGLLVVDDTSYALSLTSGSGSTVPTIRIDGGLGVNSVTIADTAQTETLTARPLSASIVSAGCKVEIEQATTMTITSQGSGDSAIVYDSTGDDTLSVGPAGVSLSGASPQSYSITVNGFTAAAVVSQNADHDTVAFRDSSGNDRFVGNLAEGTAEMRYPGKSVVARGFETVNVTRSAGGTDSVALLDSPGNDTLVADRAHVAFSGNGQTIQATGFSIVQASAFAGGNDVAQLTASASDASFLGTPQFATLIDGSLASGGFALRVAGFDSVDVNRNSTTAGGTANLYDSRAADMAIVSLANTQLTGPLAGGVPAYSLKAAGFAQTNVQFAGGGSDTIQIADSSGNDRLDVYKTWAQMTYAQQKVLVAQLSTLGKVTATSSNGGVDSKYIDETHDFLLELVGNWQ